MPNIEYLWGTRLAATPFCSRISELSAAAIDGRLTWVVKRRFLCIKNPVPEPEILAIAVAFPEKMAAFILSDLLTPLQKHHDSLRPPIFIVGKKRAVWMNFLAYEIWIYKKNGILAFLHSQMGSHCFLLFFLSPPTNAGKEMRKDRRTRWSCNE